MKAVEHKKVDQNSEPTGDVSGTDPVDGKKVSMRVSANGYLSFILIGSFFSGLLLHLRLDVAAAALISVTWLIVPVLFLTDRITFNGSFLRRTGLVPMLWRKLTGADSDLSVEDIEMVETQALRALRKGGDVFYRYRTLISGQETRFSLISGGEQYRTMVGRLLPLLPDMVLDNRSAELRDYLADPKDVQTKTRFAKIPSTAVLEETLNSKVAAKRTKKGAGGDEPDASEISERAGYLRQLANELRVGGYLVQALEVFRRALRLKPDDAWLIYEFARCLHSYASAEKNQRFERRALAALRLAEKKAAGNERLLTRLGETYFQYGDWKRAKRVFTRSLDFAGDSYRSVRGMAELSLREGKIAHVIHNFAVANRLAETPALRRWARSEAAYFERLNSDDEYMDLEISRVTMLDNLERYRKTALRIVVLGLPLIISGMIADSVTLTNVGWAVSCVALLVWTGVLISRNMLSARLPIEHE